MSNFPLILVKAHEVKKPGSKGGHPWFNTKTGHWQYGPKPKGHKTVPGNTGSVGVTNEAHSTAPLQQVEDRSTVAPPAKPESKPDMFPVGTIIRSASTAGWFYEITQAEPNAVYYNLYQDSLDGSARKVQDHTAASRKELASLVNDGSMFIVTGAEKALIKKKLAGANVEETANERNGIKVGNVYWDSQNSLYLRVDKISKKAGESWWRVQSGVASDPLASKVEKVTDERLLDFKYRTRVLGQDEPLVVAEAGPDGKLTLVPHPELEFPDALEKGDVYFNPHTGLYYHVLKFVNKGYNSYVFVTRNPDFNQSGPEGFGDSLRAGAWKRLLADGLRKVTQPEPPKNPIEKLKAGDIYYNDTVGNYMFIDSVDNATQTINFYRGYNETVSPDDDEDALESWSFDDWRQHDFKLSFRKHVDVTAIKKNEYSVGDSVSLPDRYNGPSVYTVIGISRDNVYLARTKKDNDSVGYQVYSRARLDRILSHKQGATLVSAPPLSPARLVPPPLSPGNPVYLLPRAGQEIYAFRGTKYSGVSQSDSWRVDSSNDKEVTIRPYYEHSDSKTQVIPKEDWQQHGGEWFMGIPSVSITNYTPPRPTPENEAGVASDAGVNAKKRVCAELYNRLATDPEFFNFAQQETPGEIGDNDRRSAGLVTDSDLARMNGETEIVRQQAKVYLMVRRLVHLWAVTSADTSAKAQCMQNAVADEFGIKGAWPSLTSVQGLRLNPNNSEEGKKIFSKWVEYQYTKNAPAYRKFVRAQYEATQDFFKQKNMKEITLFRGVENESGYIKIPPGTTTGTPIQVVLQPQSSFTTHPKKAFDFASGNNDGVVFKAKLPITRCISTALSGVGCLDEHEVTVLGGPPEEMLAYRQEGWASRANALGRPLTKIWKSHNQRPYAPDSTQAGADWLKRRSVPKRPYAVDGTLADADWTKRTPDIPRHEVRHILRSLGISYRHFLSLPSGKAFARRYHAWIKKSEVPLLLLGAASAENPNKSAFGLIEKAHDVSRETRDERGRWTKGNSSDVVVDKSGQRLSVGDIVALYRPGQDEPYTEGKIQGIDASVHREHKVIVTFKNKDGRERSQWWPASLVQQKLPATKIAADNHHSQSLHERNNESITEQAKRAAAAHSDAVLLRERYVPLRQEYENAIAAGVFNDGLFEVNGKHVNTVYTGVLDYAPPNSQNKKSLQVIVKPKHQTTQAQLRYGIVPGSDAKREESAYIVNKALGNIVMVPEVAIRDTPEGQSSVQRYCANAEPLKACYLDTSTAEYAQDWHNMAFFDSVVGNLDRHGGNILVTDKPNLQTGGHYLVAIDHGLTFPNPNTKTGSFSVMNGNCMAMNMLYSSDRTLLPNEILALRSLQEHKQEVSKKLAVQLPLGAIKDMWRRVAYMQKNNCTLSDDDFVNRVWKNIRIEE